ncbi:KRAB-A domain-containing 2-like isoform A [Micractinium conductrix]|uniref:KRAB-A domain-containing 2-like isoform A n=1 Tax=Micractinium conductrix TaxID=554055 RepID=A0A2P6V3Z0_9CHLO|nr:KRAB-A domain-containing 2-like isoform A [Micractinium conductrix]|eukprot:PSC68808.1 KRAB-A domain-containing 2-like isoform A [Micractinium conductrix]
MGSHLHRKKIITNIIATSELLNGKLVRAVARTLKPVVYLEDVPEYLHQAHTGKNHIKSQALYDYVSKTAPTDMGEDENGRPIVLFGVWGISRKVCEIFVQACAVCSDRRPLKRASRVAHAIRATKKNAHHQMDLADMGAHANLGGFRYLLIVFDLHTKFMWIRVLKKKEAKPIAAKAGHPGLSSSSSSFCCCKEDSSCHDDDSEAAAAAAAAAAPAAAQRRSSRKRKAAA